MLSCSQEEEERRLWLTKISWHTKYFIINPGDLVSLLRNRSFELTYNLGFIIFPLYFFSPRQLSTWLFSRISIPITSFFLFYSCRYNYRGKIGGINSCFAMKEYCYHYCVSVIICIFDVFVICFVITTKFGMSINIFI